MKVSIDTSFNNVSEEDGIWHLVSLGFNSYITVEGFEDNEKMKKQTVKNYIRYLKNRYNITMKDKYFKKKIKTISDEKLQNGIKKAPKKSNTYKLLTKEADERRFNRMDIK